MKTGYTKRNLGEVFKELRQSKNINIADACRGVCTKKTVYNFEDGISSIDSNKLFGLLKNINISFEEFGLAVNNYQPSNDWKFFQKIDRYYYKGDVAMLRKILESKRSANILLVEKAFHILVISELINKLDKNFKIAKQDIDNVAKSSMSIDKWTYYELKAFYKISHLLSIDLSCSIARNIIYKKDDFLISEDRIRCFIKTLINISYCAIQKNHLKDAKFFLQTTELLVLEYEAEDIIAFKYALKFLQGFYLLIKHCDVSACSLMIDTICRFGSEKPEVGKRYYKCYQEAREQARKKHNLNFERCL
jgi:Rgg/GadR/MutR family transcriptional activator